jgi:hypothetical protein
VTNWNTYSPKWAPVAIAAFPSATNKSLELQDRDPYDYARAVRVFPETKAVTVQFRVHPLQNQTGSLEIEITNHVGDRPVRLIFAADGKIRIQNGGDLSALAQYEPGKWYEIGLKVDTRRQNFDVVLDGKPVAASARFAEYAKSVERLSFRTGPYRNEPTIRTSAEKTPDRTSPNPDVPEPNAVYHIDDVEITPTR